MACEHSHDCTKYYAGSIVFGTTSLLVVLVFVGCYEKLARYRSPVALFLMAWWALGAALLTNYFPPFEVPRRARALVCGRCCCARRCRVRERRRQLRLARR